MRCGLYGKLPAKRDYVALGTPRDFLAAWEPWLQGGISASRLSLGPAWQGAFLKAPIWRFWLGRDVSGAVTTGALMPSVDGVGRYFPLTLFVRAEAKEGLPPPEIDPQDAWMERLEDVLLSALAPDADVEGVMAALEALGGPNPRAAATPPEGVARPAPGAWSMALAADGIAPAAAKLRLADREQACAGLSFWWTQGGDGFVPCALMSPRMPDPALYAAMLTGDLSNGFGSASASPEP